ncbi:HAD-IC family P-type ATPase [Candidatus Falkowbacteria bacterium]|nr:HAD-IC family P-type ATPase [Candidatus Falkowbacteria bacterium]
MTREILWHALTVQETLKQLNVDRGGLTSGEANKRLKKFGHNRLPAEKKLTGLQIILRQVKSPLVYILILAAVLSLLLNQLVDAAVIVVIVVINTVIGFIQENKANQAITRLQAVIQYQAKVIRAGAPTLVDTVAVVPGDIVMLEAGMKVPADCRLLEVNDLQVVEAALTGESDASVKSSSVVSADTVVADRENMAYMGTAVVRGKALAVAVATGRATEIGAIATLVKNTAEEITPLQEKIGRLARFIALSILLLTLTLFIIGLLRGRDPTEMFLVSVAVAVAAIPEGLVVALTVILVIGMQKILKKKALVRRLVAAETLGSTTVICSDKTGTLTEGAMRVVSVLADQEDFALGVRRRVDKISDAVDLALRIGMLCNDSFMLNPDEPNTPARFVGDPMEQALLMAGLSAELQPEQLTAAHRRVAEAPFSSEEMYMATVNENFVGAYGLLVKGAPEVLLARSAWWQQNGSKQALTAAQRQQLLSRFDALTSKGLRLLAVAYKPLTAKPVHHLTDLVNDLIFAGVMVLKDPLRSDARQTIALCRQAGIRPILITGDHRLTARSVAAEASIATGQESVLEGKDLDALGDAAFAQKVKTINVYARVEPRHKIRIVEELQRQGEVVAMAGDGVNDAPAIKAADIGIALGSGTDVAKETADIVLLDDNFATIVAAVRGGRVIFDNIKKVILYLLFSGFSEIILIGGAIVLDLPLPLLATQILWINIVQDSWPVFALSADPEERGIMAEAPSGRRQTIFDGQMKALIFFSGILTSAILFGIFYYFYQSGADIMALRTFIFASLAMTSLLYIYACRSLRSAIGSYNPFGNHYLNVSLLFGLFLLALAVYWPLLQRLLHTTALPWQDWLILLSIGLFNLLVIELTKKIFILKNNIHHHNNLFI